MGFYRKGKKCQVWWDANRAHSTTPDGEIMEAGVILLPHGREGTWMFYMYPCFVRHFLGMATRTARLDYIERSAPGWDRMIEFPMIEEVKRAVELQIVDLWREAER